jgi:hypothetical protein
MSPHPIRFIRKLAENHSFLAGSAYRCLYLREIPVVFRPSHVEHIRAVGRVAGVSQSSVQWIAHSHP